MAVVTGATCGVGYALALALAQAGADVIVAGPDEIAGREALASIRPQAPAALIRFEKLDVASLDSVGDFVRRLFVGDRPVDVLINNAGVPAKGARRITPDGFELHLGTNYLGHFALSALLLPLLRRSRQPRVVQITSQSHRQGTIHFDDLQLEHHYGPWKAYCQSTLAMLIFTLELQRRSDLHGWGLISSAAHPGYAHSGLAADGRVTRSLIHRLHGTIGQVLNHSAAEGALPGLFAATSQAVQRGGYYGPIGPLEFVGPPGPASVGKNALDVEVARRLWEVSEQLTGVKWQEK